MLKFWKKKGAEEAVSAAAEEAQVEQTQPDTSPTLSEILLEAAAAQPTIEQMPDAPPPQAKRSWRERLSGSVFNRDVRDLFARHPKLDEALLDELETTLIGADVGVAASTQLVETLRRRMDKREFADATALLAALRSELVALLEPVAQPLMLQSEQLPFVILMVGVNGVGKTTTIGKLARRLQTQGHSVVLAAGDTFRAAAVEQLKSWGERHNIPVIAQGSGADSARTSPRTRCGTKVSSQFDRLRR